MSSGFACFQYPLIWTAESSQCEFRHGKKLPAKKIAESAHKEKEAFCSAGEHSNRPPNNVSPI